MGVYPRTQGCNKRCSMGYSPNGEVLSKGFDASRAQRINSKFITQLYAPLCTIQNSKTVAPTCLERMITGTIALRTISMRGTASQRSSASFGDPCCLQSLLLCGDQCCSKFRLHCSAFFRCDVDSARVRYGRFYLWRLGIH